MNLSEELYHPKDATDKSIEAWRDAAFVTSMLDCQMVRSRYRRLAGLSAEDQIVIAAQFDAEFNRRFGLRTDAMVAHTVEQGEAAELDGKLEGRRLLAYRAARLCKLIELDAPDVIIDAALDLMVKGKP